MQTHSRTEDESEEEEWEMVKVPSAFAISFSGAGFLGIYHLGVIHSLLKHSPGLVNRMERFAGASAGSIAATIMATAPEKIEDCRDMMMDMARHVSGLRNGALTAGYDIMEDLERRIKDTLPPDAHRAANHRLFISITDVTNKTNVITSTYPSNQHLLKSLIASCYIPGYAKCDPPTTDGAKLMDGGFSDNLPTFANIPTICVSPFSGKVDICPSDVTDSRISLTIRKQNVYLSTFNMIRGFQALFPPKPDVLLEYYDVGQQDCIRYLQRTGHFEK